ncbi:endonuclease/exonuclease/phosphatase family protein [Subsaximicrobium wynnwilliamsii]|uniref:Endonuclease/exonuclease/phosphatase family protein n=1 Tax=Subsaximicrobium wynnwilliamsii TaxID=291179 RepID=A0A5C6ZIC4_9FLAO|nr:endonuclease/exonuclease/phosphatase family protein [Subsaximicrobium wynnwilliamsii]TXD84290.1 endonuclease/exonuclease/phosphatase family protein [Subsaximicrobium wynnwilliamsii]TXD89911.1 endonuclease/exonuclease/phosphatase family protein [Subsaximicrobium wynnwilliamsii]TXE04002.1 endonuclease/exonuclease/phosphatase family protein [Subsaximicrobium wynnwilliamsii]
MNYLEIITLVFNILICIPTLASITKFDHWLVRDFDFPRIQISFLLCVNLIAAGLVYSFQQPWHFIIVCALVICLIYQCWLIFPYTYLAKKQTLKFDGKTEKAPISILVSNVLMTNRDYSRLIDLIKLKDPDVFLTLESDKKWEEALEPFEDDYTHSIKVPLDNLYGMHLYSKLPLEGMQVKYLIKDDIPSIHGYIKLDNGKKVRIHCLHPRPPSPTESKTSTGRDAELMLIGKQIEADPSLTLVFGDLNDVAWSRTTKIFQKVSGLLDPRRGRGFFNTYSTEHFFMRWPLDHVFHSDDFTLIDISREKNIGSDHFPMYIKLNYTPEKTEEQDKLEVNQDEEDWASKKVKDGKEEDS